MKENKATGALSLSPSDLEIMVQCKMPISEALKWYRPNKNIPPLWSVLSFVLYKSSSKNPNRIWRNYRELLHTARNAALSYTIARIPKSSGGFRTLAIPNPFLRGVQETIRNHILIGLPIDGHAYAYRKGVRIADCAAPHVGQRVVLHLDIRDFFSSITEAMVYTVFLEETGYAKSLCRLLAQLCCYQGHLPQGATTSPMVSNIVFAKCDRLLGELADRYDMVYSRYSDDLFFSSAENIDISQFLAQVTQVLRKNGFRLNPQKLRIRRPHSRQEVLGLTVNEHLQVNRTYRRDLLKELYYLGRFGPSSRGALLERDYLGYLRKLQGKLAYCLSIAPADERLAEEKAKLDCIIISLIFNDNKWYEEPRNALSRQ